MRATAIRSRRWLHTYPSPLTVGVSWFCATSSARIRPPTYFHLISDWGHFPRRPSKHRRSNKSRARGGGSARVTRRRSRSLLVPLGEYGDKSNHHVIKDQTTRRHYSKRKSHFHVMLLDQRNTTVHYFETLGENRGSETKTITMKDNHGHYSNRQNVSQE